jgi:hypothetical protein
VDTKNELEVERVKFFDPTPQAIKIGRKHLYDTHRTSGLGQASCGSCHVDARMDRLGWDLGNPAGDVKSDDDQNLGLFNPLLITKVFEDFHPMKGPLMTQTLRTSSARSRSTGAATGTGLRSSTWLHEPAT